MMFAHEEQIAHRSSATVYVLVDEHMLQPASYKSYSEGSCIKMITVQFS